MKKIFITGAGGFLGKNLVKRLAKENYTIIAPSSKECNLLSETGLNNYINEKYDLIYHLAAWTQAGDFCSRYRGDQWVINQYINTNVLNWWKMHQSQAKLITFGTSVSYLGHNIHYEKDYMDGIPYGKYYGYAMTKRMLLSGLECLRTQYNMNYLYLIPSTLYGENYHTDKRQPHFIYDLIRKIILGKNLNVNVNLWGDGYQRRELVYVKDAVEWIVNLSDLYSNKIINLGAGCDYSIRDFARKICNEVDFDFKKINFDTSQFVGAKSKVLSIKKLERLLPNRLQTPIEEGVRNTLNWVKNNML